LNGKNKTFYFPASEIKKIEGAGEFSGINEGG
jgi:hypothetical protein